MMTAMNHYGMEFDENDLQSMERTSESHGPKVVTPGPESAMLDGGATCSAGPETSVRRLIAAIMEKDSGATIEVNTKVAAEVSIRKWEVEIKLFIGLLFPPT